MKNEELVERIQSGISVTDNMEQLYYGNLPLIRKIIVPYTYYEMMDDLLQESYFGLYEAAKRYDKTVGVKFMSYASFWIRQAVQRYIETSGSCVRIPNHFNTLINRYRKYEGEHLAKCGELPDMEQIKRDLRITEKQMQDIKCYMLGIKSLDQPLHEGVEGETYTLADTVADDIDIAQEVTEREYRKQIYDDLQNTIEFYLTDKEKQVMMLCYIENKTQEEISRCMGIPLQEVKRVKAGAIRHLRGVQARESLMKHMDMDRQLYYGTRANFENYGSSVVEYVALRRIQREKRI